MWLTQAQMAELFQTTRANVTIHIGNVLEEGALPESSVCKDDSQTAADGKSYSTKHSSLDMIIAVGYRVRPGRGTQFRQWATATLAEYLTKGFALDDTRLKEAKGWGADYFDELLARRPALLGHRGGLLFDDDTQEQLARPEAKAAFVLLRRATA